MINKLWQIVNIYLENRWFWKKNILTLVFFFNSVFFPKKTCFFFFKTEHVFFFKKTLATCGWDLSCIVSWLCTNRWSVSPHAPLVTRVSYLSIRKIPLLHHYMIQLVPHLWSWVHPGCFVDLLQLESRICYGKLMFSTQSQESMTVCIATTNTIPS